MGPGPKDRDIAMLMDVAATQRAMRDNAAKPQEATMDEEDIRILSRQNAMRIASGLPTSKDAALLTLDYARDLIIQAHACEEARKTLSDRAEGE